MGRGGGGDGRGCSCSLMRGEAFAELAPGSASAHEPGGMWGRRAAGGAGAELRRRSGSSRRACYVVVEAPSSHRPGRRGRPFYSGKHRARHELQVIAARRGHPVGVRAAARLGADKKAEWIWGVLAELEAAGLVVLAHKGYQGSTHAKTPYKGRTSRNPRKTPTARTRNSARPASARTPSSRPGRSSGNSAAAPGKREAAKAIHVCRSATL